VRISFRSFAEKCPGVRVPRPAINSN